MSSAKPSRAPNVIEQVWSMISELGFSKTIFQSHITKIEKSLEADLKKYHDTMVNSDICKSELQTLQLKFGELTRTKTILERDVERKSEDYNHVLKQLNNALIQKRDLELKNQSIISSETKDVLELEILQLKQNLQESTENSKTLNEKLIDSLKQINFLETKNKKLIWNMDSIKVARKLSDDVFTKANSLGTGKIDTNYRPGIGRESFENELANSSTNSASSSTNQIKHINKTANTPLTKPKVFEKQPKKPVQPYLIHQKQISKQKPKPFQKPFENHFQDITFNHSRNFQKPSNQKVLNHNHQKDFQNHYPHPRYEEHFSNISSNLGYPSPNHRSYESTGFQKQITFWLNMINQIKPLHPQKPNSYNKVKNRIKPTSNSPNPEAQTHTRIPTRRPDPSLQYPRSTHTKCLSKCLTEFPRTPSRVPEHIPITPGSRSKDLGHHRSFSATTKPLPRSIDTTPIIISVTNLHPQPQSSSTISASAPIPISNHLQPQRFPPHLHRYGSHHQPHDSIPFTISAIEATIRTARSSQFIYHPQFDQPQRSTFPNSNPQPQQAKAHNLLDEMPDRAYLGNDQDTIEPCPDKPSRDRYSARAYQLFDEMPEPTPRLRSGFLGHLLGHHQPLLEQPISDPRSARFLSQTNPTTRIRPGMDPRATAVVNNLEDAHELIDKAIYTALKESKPVYISVACNLPSIPHHTFSSEPIAMSLSPKLSNNLGLKAAVEAAAVFFNKAVKPVMVGGPKLRVANACQAFVELADASGYALAVMPSGKGLVPEHHPHFIGTYWGVVSTPFCSEIVESADAYVFVGPLFNDFSSVGYSLLLKKEKALIVQPDHVIIGNGPTFGCILMKDFLQELAKRVEKNTTAYENYRRIYVPEGNLPPCVLKEPLRVNVLFGHIQKMLSSDTIVIAETGDSWFNCQKLKLPKGCGYEFQMQYGSIGWSVGATLGYAQAAIDKRVIACIGDGSFQMTAQDVSTMMRCGQKNIIFLINNGGYTTEVQIHDGPYNVIKNWNYVGLVEAIHNGQGYCWTKKVRNMSVFCEEDLIEAIETATGAKKDYLCFIEVMTHKDDTSKELLVFGSRVAATNSWPPNPR
ncbi:hypothetical protein LXL04_036066 [Taraxacum kok-saghyz]